MSERDSGEPGHGFAETVSRAVERETRRRRRLLALYIALLAIPVISAVVLIGLGVDEQRMQAQMAAAGPDTIMLAAPPEELLSEIDFLRARFEDQEMRIAQLDTRVERATRDPVVTAPVTERPDLTERLQRVEARLQQLRSIDQRLARLEAQNQELRTTVDSLRSRLRSID